MSHDRIFAIWDEDIDVLFDAMRAGISHAFEPDFDGIEGLNFIIGDEITQFRPHDQEGDIDEELEPLQLLVLEVRIAARVGDANPDVELVTIMHEWPTWMWTHVPEQRVFKIGVMDGPVDAAALLGLKKINSALADVLLAFGAPEESEDDEDETL